MRAKIALAAVLAAGIVLSGGSVAQADIKRQTITCAAGKPVRNSNGTWFVNVASTNAPRYTGKPFSFKLRVVHLSIGGAPSRVYTYVGTPRAYTTPNLGSTARSWVTLEAWQSGTKCKTATR